MAVRDMGAGAGKVARALFCGRRRYTLFVPGEKLGRKIGAGNRFIDDM